MCKVVGLVRSRPSLVSNHLSHTASFAAWVAVMYSASVLDRAMMGCFLDDQLMAAPARMKMKLDIDFLSFMSLAQSASTKPRRVVPCGVPRL